MPGCYFYSIIFVFIRKEEEIVKRINLIQLSLRVVLLCMSVLTQHLSFAQEDLRQQETPPPNDPLVHSASGEGQLAIKQFKFSSQLTCELFAAEPDVANIVGFHRDYQGRTFVCESFRQAKDSGVEDNRYHAYWMDEELQAQTVQDRINYILKHVPNAPKLYRANDDRIRQVVDQNGDGIADKATVFANRFNKLEMGTGADVFSYRNQVYFTCIPDLFLLTDKNGDGQADQRRSLHSGYGVRFAFRGHDLHGLTLGPDGRLYFSIGDRGYNVSSDVMDPTTGAVFRCELDGSNLEVFCSGLRNPQNLAFDDLGNLFTGDNNSDSGDKARWVYLVPGGDSGWRMYYQYLPDRGPFNREKIWHPFHQDSPAYIIPPIENISDGPSGLEYYPGTGFGDDYQGRFFLCDFRGTAINSGIRSFRNEQVGAFFRLVDAEQPIWGILPTDIQFGSDGKMYVSDWVNGWVGENKGRLYTFSDKQYSKSEIVKEVESLLKNGLEQQSKEQLVRLIGHRDRRVRQEAQFELVRRKEFDALVALAETGTDRLSRVHAMWGLAQLWRTHSGKPAIFDQHRLSKLVDGHCFDADFEIRAQVAHLVGETGTSAQPVLLQLLKDENLRVRYYASMALSKIGDKDCLAEVARLLAENNEQDPIIRHGGIMAFYGVLLRGICHPSPSAQVESIKKLIDHKSASVRLGLVVAIRKLLSLPKPKRNELPSEAARELLAKLLNDPDGDVCLEAARAVYDLPVNELMDKLAEVQPSNAVGKPRQSEANLQDALTSRIIQANYRTGNPRSAQRLGELANSNLPIATRIQALNALKNWMTPANNDPLLHDWRPVSMEGRKLSDAQKALSGVFEQLVGSDALIMSSAVEAVGKLQIAGFEDVLKVALLSKEQDVNIRIQSLRSLSQMDPQNLPSLLHSLHELYTVQTDSFPLELAVEMARIGAKDNEVLSVSILEQIVKDENSPKKIKQEAIKSAATFASEPAKKWLLSLLKQVEQKTYPAELRLDVVLSAQVHADQAIRAAAKNYLQQLESESDPSARFADTIAGGDFEAGKLIFETKSEVSCIRCHRVDGTEVAVGPNLAHVGSKRTRQHLLDSIVQPNKEISERFGQIKVQTIDGLLLTGLLQEDTETALKLLDADGQTTMILKQDIEDVQPGLSSMPLDLVKQLSLAELRDLIEFLAQQQDSETRSTTDTTRHGKE
jgi:quinoprotein glucose dehydrogenase